jgi:hypothetical protein
MCKNDSCELTGNWSIEESGYDAVSLLEAYELSRFEESFGDHPDLDTDEQLRFTSVVFPRRKYCWWCARDSISKEMGWNFDLLDLGIALNEHCDYEYIRECRSLGQEWYDLLLWNVEYKRVDFTQNGEVKGILLEYIANEVKTESIKSIAEWYDSEFDESIDAELLTALTNGGFRDYSDLALLSCSNLYEEIHWSELPTKLILTGMENGMETFVRYRQVLWDLTESIGEEPLVSVIEKLWKSGVGISELETLVESLLQDDELDAVFSDLDAYGLDPAGGNVFEAFASTVNSLIEVGLEVTGTNLVKFWGLAPLMILYVVDNGLLADDVLRIARWVGEPDALIGWITSGEVTIPINEVRSWFKFGFDAAHAEKWRSAGFDAESAAKWRAIIDDPIAARRRMGVGIQPT